MSEIFHLTSFQLSWGWKEESKFTLVKQDIKQDFHEKPSHFFSTEVFSKGSFRERTDFKSILKKTFIVFRLKNVSTQFQYTHVHKLIKAGKRSASAKAKLVLQPVDFGLQPHQLLLKLFGPWVALTDLMQDGQVLVGPDVQSDLTTRSFWVSSCTGDKRPSGDTA